MVSYFLICPEHRHTPFLNHHADRIYTQFEYFIDVLCIDREFGASRRGLLGLFRVVFLIARLLTGRSKAHAVTITPKVDAIEALLRSFGFASRQAHRFTDRVRVTSRGLSRLAKKLSDQCRAMLIRFCVILFANEHTFLEMDLPGSKKDRRTRL